MVERGYREIGEIKQVRSERVIYSEIVLIYRGRGLWIEDIKELFFVRFQQVSKRLIAEVMQEFEEKERGS